VRLQVALEQMIFRGRVGNGQLDPPAIDIRRADTNVIVQDGYTVVLGGLRQQRKLEGSSGVPWLSQIPVLGWLFKSKNYDQSKLELVLMMTPRIIADQLTINDREKYWYEKIDDNWHLPDWFFDDVKNEYDK
jgi:type II secretory pathway component GspD/PulD (secretin)